MRDNLKNLFLETIKNFENISILVIGDLMVDEHIWGEVERISPEAPVPVVNVKKITKVPGGAGNVVNNLSEMGIKTFVCGIVGNDHNGDFLKKFFKNKNVDVQGIFVSDNRPTTVKTRVIAHQQQLCRIDKEISSPIEKDTVKKILKFVEKVIKNVDAIILSDYKKGVLIPEVITNIINIANKNSKIISVDPKVEHFFYYKNVSFITPNHHEASEAVKKKINSQEDVYKIGKYIMKKLNLKSLIITQSKDGMTVFAKNKKPVHISTNALQVFDVTGAGDTVISIATASNAAGLDIEKSAILANYAAGIVVGKVGTTTVTKNELLSVIEKL